MDSLSVSKSSELEGSNYFTSNSVSASEISMQTSSNKQQPLILPSQNSQSILNGERLMALLTSQTSTSSNGFKSEQYPPSSLTTLTPSEPIAEISHPSNHPVNNIFSNINPSSVSESVKSTPFPVPTPPGGSSPSSTPTASAVSHSNNDLLLDLTKGGSNSESNLFGRILEGENPVYDIDVRIPGEEQPQLEVKPITVYGSEYLLAQGRQVAVNHKYISYALKGGSIRVLDINTGVRALLRGHLKRITDMVFSSEDVHRLASVSSDGRFYVRNLIEIENEEGKIAITEKMICAFQFQGPWTGEICPQLCFNATNEDIVYIAIDKWLIKVYLNVVFHTIKSFDSNPVVCNVEFPINGILSSPLNAEKITSLSPSLQLSDFLLVSSSDGNVQIRNEYNFSLLSSFIPYGGSLVQSAIFLSPNQSKPFVFILTGGALNRELKLWASTEPDPQTSLTKSTTGWKCLQTLQFQASKHLSNEKAFFNKVHFVKKHSLIILTNTLARAIYVIHVNFKDDAFESRFDYLTEFSVTIPILSFTVTSDEVNPDRLIISCVQTSSIQQYSLDVMQSIPPVTMSGQDSSESKSNVSVSPVHALISSDSCLVMDSGNEKILSSSSSSLSPSPCSASSSMDLLSDAIPSLSSSQLDHPLTVKDEKDKLNEYIHSIPPSTSSAPLSSTTKHSFGENESTVRFHSGSVAEHTKKVHFPSSTFLYNTGSQGFTLLSNVQLQLYQTAIEGESSSLPSVPLHPSPPHPSPLMHLVTPTELLNSASQTKTVEISSISSSSSSSSSLSPLPSPSPSPLKAVAVTTVESTLELEVTALSSASMSLFSPSPSLSSSSSSSMSSPSNQDSIFSKPSDFASSTSSLAGESSPAMPSLNELSSYSIAPTTSSSPLELHSSSISVTAHNESESIQTPPHPSPFSPPPSLPLSFSSSSDHILPKTASSTPPSSIPSKETTIPLSVTSDKHSSLPSDPVYRILTRPSTSSPSPSPFPIPVESKASENDSRIMQHKPHTFESPSPSSLSLSNSSPLVLSHMSADMSNHPPPSSSTSSPIPTPSQSIRAMGFENADKKTDGKDITEVEEMQPVHSLPLSSLSEVEAMANLSSQSPSVNATYATSNKGKKSKNKVLFSTPITSSANENASMAIASSSSSSSASLPSSSSSSSLQSSSSSMPLFSSGHAMASSQVSTLAPHFVENMNNQFDALQQSIVQLTNMQKDSQKNMLNIIYSSISKECKRIEMSVGMRIEKSFKSQSEAMNARMMEEFAKREKVEKERMHAFSSSVKEYAFGEVRSGVEDALRKEMDRLGPILAQQLTPSFETTLTASSSENFKKLFLQMDRIMSNQIEQTLTESFGTSFQNSIRNSLQETLRSCLEASIIPSFEKACQKIFEQVDFSLQRGISEHSMNMQRNLDSSHSSLATSLQESISMAAKLASTLKSEVGESMKKMQSMADHMLPQSQSLTSAPALVSASAKPTNGALPPKALSLQHLEESLDPTIEISKMVAETRYEDAFLRALNMVDINLVTWLCKQVNPQTVFKVTGSLLSQGVLLSLIQQLGVDLKKESSLKLQWIKNASMALNPMDSTFSSHMKPILEQLYQNLLDILPLASSDNAQEIRINIHIVNSLLRSCQ